MELIVIILGIIIIFASIIYFKRNERILRNEIDNLKKENNNKKPSENDEQKINRNNVHQPVKQNELPTYLNEEVFSEIYELMEKSNNSIFITGKAGTGKSTLIEYFKTKTRKNTVYLAPTGVAALNIKGKTIHSFFKFPHEIVTSDAIEKINYKEKDIDIFKRVETLIIDEISMVRADIIQGIDYVLKIYRNDNKSFGGVQMIFIGDMYQLPPVIDKKDIKITHKGKVVFAGHIIDYFQLKYGGPYFFNSDAFKNSMFTFYELNTVFRQNDNDFINLLNSIRENKIDENTLDTLNKQYNNSTENDEDNRIMLCTRKGTAQNRNKNMLAKLQTPSITFSAEVTGSFTNVKSEDYPAEKELILKQGSQVMILVNDKEGRWVNGTIGIITDLSKDKIVIEINNIQYTINKNIWEAIDYEYDKELDILKTIKTGEFVQYPLILAWAITIHKSQGETFEKVTIDLDNGAFAHGQTYVALSRCKTLEGIILQRPVRRKDIIVDDEVTMFINKMNRILENKNRKNGI